MEFHTHTHNRKGKDEANWHTITAIDDEFAVAAGVKRAKNYFNQF